MVACYRGSMIPWYSGTMVQGGEETVPELWKLFPRGWRPVKMHTNEHPVPQTIGKMRVVGSKLCKRAERGCNLSKRFMSRGGAAPPPLALAEIASSPSSFAQFAANHLHFVNVYCNKGARLYVFLRVAPQFGNSFLQMGRVSSPPCIVTDHF